MDYLSVEIIEFVKYNIKELSPPHHSQPGGPGTLFRAHPRPKEVAFTSVNQIPLPGRIDMRIPKLQYKSFGSKPIVRDGLRSGLTITQSVE